VTRLPDGGWLLHGSPPEVLDDLAPPSPWRHGRGKTLAVSSVDGAEEPVEQRLETYRDIALQADSSVLLRRCRTRRGV
jgi:hypothetical protein